MKAIPTVYDPENEGHIRIFTEIHKPNLRYGIPVMSQPMQPRRFNIGDKVVHYYHRDRILTVTEIYRNATTPNCFWEIVASGDGWSVRAVQDLFLEAE